MADHPNVELLRRGYAAHGAGDLDTVNELFADDVVWHVADGARSPATTPAKSKSLASSALDEFWS